MVTFTGKSQNVQPLDGAPSKGWECMAVGSLGAEAPMAISLGKSSDRRSEFFTDA